jgi:pyruvate-ferredoxin/flavodoxin oxidoreductase
MKEKAQISYEKKGHDVVEMNWAAIDAGAKQYVKVEIPESWKDATDEDLSVTATGDNEVLVGYVNSIQNAINSQTGNQLPVSAFNDFVDGTLPLGSAAFEKRGVAVDVPNWNPENCIQCNFCSYVCPHAAIRPVAYKDGEEVPGSSLDMTGVPGVKFAITVSVLDCTGCGSCSNVCPGKKGEKALTMQSLESQLSQQDAFNAGIKIDTPDEVMAKFPETGVKGSQFKQPLLEFSGACAGCGETPYAKLVTQLFGDKAYIANATGCSSIWGGSSPASPYTTNKFGKGPAWANSLFEDNAEYGFGMKIGQNALRDRVVAAVENLASSASGELKEAIDEFLATKDNSTKNAPASDKLVAALASAPDSEDKAYILDNVDYLSKKSQWIFGGDGWAYDIGYGGLDHVLAQGKDLNVLVFDTEVYSNTGGQSSKATPTGAIAQFAAGGKETKKKDLAAIAMQYGYVYVAQIAMGANMKQCIDALIEAENYPGPSLVIAYAPCINHGIKGGMKNAMNEEKAAVAAGYWNLFRYNPALKEAGENPFKLDSKTVTADYKEFIQSEVRYNRLSRSNPERAQKLFEKAEKDAKEKFERLKAMAEE